MIRLDRIDGNRPGPVWLHFETGDRLEIPSRVLKRLDLKEGEYYSLQSVESEIEETYRKLLPELARNHLTRYPKTTDQFLDHFQKKGYPKSLLEPLVDRLREEGFLDDEEVARQHIRRRIERKFYGRRKILAELQSKGIARSTAKDLLRDLYPFERERKKAEEFAGDHSDLSPGKLASRLQNRGFPAGIIRKALDQIS